LEVVEMTDQSRDPAIRGKTIQFRWTEGPTKGTTHEHVFHHDGTVEWRDAARSEPERGGAQPSRPAEKPPYAAIKVAEEAYLVSYLAASGYTLTVVLNFRDQQLIGFASAAKEWYPVRGTFTVVK
jgi:molybdenum cofactor biosynthesis protein MoaF